MFLRCLFKSFNKQTQTKVYQGEISLLRQQCAQFIAEERLRRTKSDGDIVVRTCEFSKLQFPKSQIEAQFIRRSYVELSPCQMQFKQLIIR